MYVRGASGTRKSQVIKAVREYFSKTNQEDKLEIATFTTSASLSINDSTIHSLIGLSINQNVDTKIVKNSTGNWAHIEYLIFDEIFMIGCIMLADIHLKMQKLRSSPLKPFGNVNIMFLGDFI